MARRIQVLWLKMMWLLFAVTAFAGCLRSHDVDGPTATATGKGGTHSGATCDVAACQPSALGYAACCTADDVCGLEANKIFSGAGCLEADAPGEVDSSCPSGNLNISGTPVSVDGCCKDDGTCGLMDTYAGLGCTSDPSRPKGAACGNGGGGNGGGGNGAGGNGGTMASTCDPASCQASTLGLTACCTDTDLCGYDANAFFAGAGCLEANAPGSADSSCPSATVTVMGFTVNLPGCCRGDGTCGVMDMYAGLGCTLNPNMTMGAGCAGPQ